MKHRSDRCHARNLSFAYTTLINDTQAQSNSHNHRPDTADCDAKYSMFEMKSRIKDSHESMGYIVADLDTDFNKLISKIKLFV